jgi:hypothetical protein
MSRTPGLIRGGLLVALVAALLGAGCSATAVGSAAPTSNPVTSAPGTTLPKGTESLVGHYAHFDVVAYQDDKMKTLIISTGFSDLEMRDGKLWNVQRFCHADTVSDQKIDISISDAATRAIVPIATPVEVSERDGKLRVVRPATPTAIGIKLEDPTHESLPKDPNDPRVFDADGDGNPGVTSHVKVTDDLQGDIYLARREIFAYDVTQQSPDRMVGSITDRSEQLIIGASNPIFMVAAQWKQVDDPARNPVIWQRVGADWDCDRLAAERAATFPPNPVADW